MRYYFTLLSVFSAMVALAQSPAPAPAPQPQNVKPAGATPVKPQTKVFEVADLLGSELPTLGMKKEESKTTNASRLIKLVTSMVRPYSWEADGGKGKIEFIEASDSLVVTNSPEVQSNLRDLLESLRKLR